MNNTWWIFLVLSFVSCSTVHYRSNNLIPVTFESNPLHQIPVEIKGVRHFYFWGVDPEHHEVYVDEEVKNAGYDSISKLIIYEPKDPTDILISFLTFGIYIPRSYSIMGFAQNRTANIISDDNSD